MATTHVFIVDTNNFKYHLEYKFAGTGAKENSIDFNNTSKTKLHYATENNLVGMIADSQRVRKGDYIIFYLQQNVSSGIYEGKFFGIFRVKEGISFLDNNDDKQFLKSILKKSLTFRALIEPYKVYSKGVTEWEALDEIKYIHSPNQMLWSLIYRKLKANRGNTMITIYESERLSKLLKDKNNRQVLTGDNFSFDSNKQEIFSTSIPHKYLGRMEKINILPRLLCKHIENKSFECHLQAYIVQNIGKNALPDLNNILLSNYSLEWIGNEVSCGVGMQRIDIMLSLFRFDNERIIVPIELKTVEASVENIIQIQRYVDWIQQYYLPNRISDICPVLIAKKPKNRNFFSNIRASFKDFNKRNSICLPLKYIKFEIYNNSLIFNEIQY
ncbi:MAG: DUF91 domain-containing protein [Actinobacteria bacterium]|nr:DUF91 domain-containing protein [Actinomycetota bacterium]